MNKPVPCISIINNPSKGNKNCLDLFVVNKQWFGGVVGSI